MTAAPPDVSVVVPTYERPGRLANCLAALALLEFPRARFEVIVVDDGSTTPVQPVADAYRDALPLTVHRQANGGPARARNAGAERASGRWLAFTDDDCAPTPGWLAALVGCLTDHPDALVGGRTVNGLPDNRYAEASQLLVTYITAYYASADRIGFFASNNIAVPAGRFRALGGFDEHFPLAAGEDRDLCARWAEQGGELVHTPDAVVEHVHALDLAGFWRQHLNYGRGAASYHGRRAARGGHPPRLEPLRFYLDLVRSPLRSHPPSRALPLVALLSVSQVANAAGFLKGSRQTR